MLQRDHAYPPAAVALFERLGINPQKEAEIYHFFEDDAGLQHYGVWFHFVGSIESAPELHQVVSGRYSGELFGANCRIGFRTAADLAPESFLGKPLVQVEFETVLPWILQTPSPGR